MRRAPGLPSWQATMLAAAVAGAVFLFAMVWKGWIILAAVCAGLWLGTWYLRRLYPLFDEFCSGFAKGFLGRR